MNYNQWYTLKHIYDRLDAVGALSLLHGAKVKIDSKSRGIYKSGGKYAELIKMNNFVGVFWMEHYNNGAPRPMIMFDKGIEKKNPMSLKYRNSGKATYLFISLPISAAFDMGDWRVYIDEEINAKVFIHIFSGDE